MNSASPSLATRKVILYLVWCVVATLCCTARNAFADDTADEADHLFNMGADAYEAHDYNHALEYFLASNRLVPNRNVLFNVARTYEQLKKGSEAYRYYVQVLESETNPTVQKKIEDALKRISPSIAILKVETFPAGATVYLDRKDLGPRGTTPRTIGLTGGKHKVIVELPGYEPMELAEPIELTVGQTRAIEFRLRAVLGSVRIEGDTGAKARIDNDGAQCVMPCSLETLPGKRVVSVEKPGFVPAEYTVDIPPRGSVNVHTSLQAETGSLVVNADVREALIEVDDQPRGFTPAVLSLSVGKHTLRVARSGFRAVKQELEIKKGSKTELNLELTSQQEVQAASRITESVEDAPASVSIISRDELRAMGYPTIAEAVRGVRGMYLSNDTIYDTVGVRGYSRPGDYGNRVLILFDGHPMNDNYIWSSYVGFDGRVDIDDVERIEIIRGPGSVLYGTSAFFGVINLVTRPRNLPTFGEASIGTAGNGVGKARATAYYRMNKDTGMWISVSGARASGRDYFFSDYRANPQDPNAEKDVRGFPSDGNARNQDSFDAATVSARLWHKSFTAQWFLTSRLKRVPSAQYGGLFGDERQHAADTRGMMEVKFEPEVSNTVQTLSRAHLNFYDFDQQVPRDVGPVAQQFDTYRGRWAGLEQRIVAKPTDSLRITAGAEGIYHFQTLQLLQDSGSSAIFDDQGRPGRNDPFVVGAGYLLGDLTPSKTFKLSAGARLDYYGSLPKFDVASAVNPRLAAVIKPYAAGNLKLMFGKAFRAPSVYELFYTSPTQPRPSELKPESILAGEVEFSHRFSPTWVGTVSSYVNSVSDLIELRDVPGTRCANGSDCTQYGNSNAKLFIWGVEGELRREWREGWMVAVTASHQRARYVDAPTLRLPPNSVDFLGSIKGAAPIVGRALIAMTRLTFEGPRPDRNVDSTVVNPDGTPGPAQGKTDPGLLWDLVLSGEAEKVGIRYNLGFYNLMDFRYDVIPSGEFRQRSIVQSGRTALASITATF